MLRPVRRAASPMLDALSVVISARYRVDLECGPSCSVARHAVSLPRRDRDSGQRLLLGDDELRGRGPTPTTPTARGSSTPRSTAGSTSSRRPTCTRPTASPRRSSARRSPAGATGSSSRPSSPLPMGDDPNQRGSSRRWIMLAVENSLRRLQTDWIDLYQMHRPDPQTDLEETIDALSDLVHQGKIRAFGSSTCAPHQVVEGQWQSSDRRYLRRFRPSSRRIRCSPEGRGLGAAGAARYGMGLRDHRPTHDRAARQPAGGSWVEARRRHAGPVDEIVAPGTNLTTDGTWRSPALSDPALRRRPAAGRAAA